MGNIEDVTFKLIAHMDEDQYELYKNMYDNLMRKKRKEFDWYAKFNLAAKILSQYKTEIPKSH
tara:strand:+ start:929 stop:1117 length:189 start_codon:yes stop_codon:yes gene_type:complete